MMTGTTPSYDRGLSPSDESLSPSAPSSRFDKVLEHVQQYEAGLSPSAESSTPSEETPEESSSPSAELEQQSYGGGLPPSEDPELNLTEKERVLRKVLGEKYQQGDEE